MSRASTPVRDGFAALRHEPMLLAAELAWRWCFGLAAVAVSVVAVGLFLDSLRVSKLDRFLLSTWQPQFLNEALRHIFHGSLARFLLELAVLVPGLTVLCAFAGAAGRAGILRRMVDMFGSDDEPQAMSWHFRSIFLLQLLRLIWAQVALGVVAAFLIHGSTMAARQRPLAAALALSFGAGLAGAAGYWLNWYLGIAPLFCIREDASARQGLDYAFSFSLRHSGRLLWVGLSFLAFRAVWAGAMCWVFLAPLNLAGRIGGRWVAVLMAALALVYFAGADLLRLARWGAYLSLAEGPDDAEAVAEAEVPPPPSADLLPLEGLA